MHRLSALVVVGTSLLSTTALAAASIDGGPCTLTPQAALNTATSGQKVRIEPGTYVVSGVVLDEDIEVVSAGAGCSGTSSRTAHLVGNNVDSMIRVDGATVQFDGMVLRSNNLTAVAGPILQVTSGAAVGLIDSAIRQGVTTLTGGGALVNGGSVLSLSDGSVIEDNEAEYGAGVYVSDGWLYVLSSSTIRNNDADEGGGGIAMHSGTATIWGSVTGNTARYGAGVYGVWTGGSGGTLSVWGGSVSGNDASVNGGGVYLADSGHTARFHDGAVLSDNEAWQGAGAYISSGSLTIEDDARVSGNAASGDGGGIFLESNAVATLDHARVEYNSASSGGGMVIETDAITTDHLMLADNTAIGDGGGAIVRRTTSQTGSLSLDNVRVLRNEADEGGGLYVDDMVVDVGSDFDQCDTSTLTKDRFCTEFRDNNAVRAGGLLVVGGAEVDVYAASFVGNTSGVLGAGARVEDTGSWLRLRNALVTDHGSPVSGLYADDNTTMHVRSSTLADNHHPAAYAAGASGSFHRNIVWDNTGTLQAGGISGNCNILQAVAPAVGAPTGSANVVDDPDFDTANARSGYKLLAASPAIDACGTGPATDLDGVSRAQGSSYDRGAFEMP